MKERR